MKTRREIKHELLLTFIENAKAPKKKIHRNNRPRLLGTLLSFFL